MRHQVRRRTGLMGVVSRGAGPRQRREKRELPMWLWWQVRRHNDGRTFVLIGMGRFDKHQAGNPGTKVFREDHVVGAAERVPYQHKRPLLARSTQKRVQVLRRLLTTKRARARIAPHDARPAVRACPGHGCDRGLDSGPAQRSFGNESGLEDDCRRAGPPAIELQTARADIDHSTGRRISAHSLVAPSLFIGHPNKKGSHHHGSQSPAQSLHPFFPSDWLLRDEDRSSRCDCRVGLESMTTPRTSCARLA